MKIKYCLPIIKNTKREVLATLKTKGYDFYEVWVDYIKDFDDKFLIGITKKYPGKIIFVFRRQNLEKFKLPLERRLKIISLLSKTNAFLDLDFLSQQEELDHFKTGFRLKLILSYHNYKGTPGINYLKTLADKMKRYNPDIIKIAAFCNRKEDSLNLLNFLLQLKQQQLKYIVLGMGRQSLITRIFGPLWSNEINFSPETLSEKTAPGQLTKKQLEVILRNL